MDKSGFFVIGGFVMILWIVGLVIRLCAGSRSEQAVTDVDTDMQKPDTLAQRVQKLNGVFRNTLLGVDAGEKQMTVRWSGSKYFTGYQIRYSTDPTFKTGSVAFKVTRPDAYRNTVKNLVSGKTYYVQVRSYHEFEGMTYFGEWSEALSCTVR